MHDSQDHACENILAISARIGTEFFLSRPCFPCPDVPLHFLVLLHLEEQLIEAALFPDDKILRCLWVVKSITTSRV